MLDFHLHVWPHHPGTPVPTFAQLEKYCEKARSQGIDQIAITEHCHRFTRTVNEVMAHWARPRGGRVSEATDRILAAESGGDLDDYVSALVDAQDRGLPLLVGLEVDYWPGTVEPMRDLLAEYPFDILLGSVHWIDDWLFDAYETAAFAQEWNERDVDDVYARYVDSITELATSGLVDVLAHLDVIKVGGHRPSRPAEHQDRLLRAVIDSGVVVEFSSAGLRKPIGETYPAIDALRELAAAGVGFTTASDAHVVDQIGMSYDRLRSMLAEVGVTELVSFRRRERIAHQLVLD